MREYNYSVLDRNNIIIKGKMTALSLQEVKGLLLLEGYKIVKIHLNYFSLGNLFGKRLNNISSLELALFCKQMSIIAKSGVTITKGLTMVKSQTDSRNVRKLCENLYTNIQKGQSVTQAFQNSLFRLPPILISMVKIGEMTGNMGEIFWKMSEYFEKEANTRKKIADSLVYPSILIILSFTVINIFLLKVLPQMTGVIISAGGHLPEYANYLLDISNYIKSNYSTIISIFLLAVFGIVFVLPIQVKEKIRNLIMFNVPVIKKVTKDFVTARFVRSMGVLIKTGLTALIALDTLEHAMGISKIEKKLGEVKYRINKGESLSSSLEQIGYFDSMVINIISIGEETGSLDDSLIQLADYYEQKFETGLKRTISVIEPLFTIGMGVIIGAIVLSVMLPMFDMIGSISRRG